MLLTAWHLLFAVYVPRALFSKGAVAVVFIASAPWAPGRACVEQCAAVAIRQMVGVCVIKSHISRMRTPHEPQDRTSVRVESNGCSEGIPETGGRNGDSR